MRSKVRLPGRGVEGGGGAAAAAKESLVDDAATVVQGSDPILMCIYTWKTLCRLRVAIFEWGEGERERERRGGPMKDREEREPSRASRDTARCLMNLEI